ncbi:OmpA family protein [Acinetobacter shaoyimingii]|uniref:OmpA family protein n=1 Tax=Acinetobacter shaoyimingii TaxID=2715164 RepID=A0A6G8RY27_9GAMM|nr:OmpA family protein [Acinetobacter shaoyimingii]NHB58676.1 OmpA family protein [Acinetobacter shaoyimingii]QIO06807.1 OmpA family protein [Acinetobacter shaoyimingii]
MSKKLFLTVSLSVLFTGCATQCVIPSPKAEKQSYNKHILNELKNGVNIYFEKGSTQVEPQYLAYLDTVAKSLAQNSSYVLELEGHTDSTGSLAANKKVSLNRANTIRNKLIVEYNVNPNQVKAFGVGPDKPIASNATEEGRAKNRRVSGILKIQ